MSEPASSPSDAAAPGIGLGHLFARVALVEARVRAMVEHRRRDDPAPDDPFRGLYLTDDDVDRLLAARTPGPPRDDAELQAVEQAAGPSRLRALQEACDLTDLDVEILLAALVPDLDARFERLYGYLNDDVTRRRATVGLALEIGAARPTAAAARGRLAAGAPLLNHLLVTVEEPERPFLSRGLRVPDRVAAHLLGADDPDAALTDVLAEVTPTPGGLADDLGRVAYRRLARHPALARAVARAGSCGWSTCATTAGGPAPRSPPPRWRRPDTASSGSTCAGWRPARPRRSWSASRGGRRCCAGAGSSPSRSRP